MLPVEFFDSFHEETHDFCPWGVLQVSWEPDLLSELHVLLHQTSFPDELSISLAFPRNLFKKKRVILSAWTSALSAGKHLGRISLWNKLYGHWRKAFDSGQPWPLTCLSVALTYTRLLNSKLWKIHVSSSDWKSEMRHDFTRKYSLQ